MTQADDTRDYLQLFLDDVPLMDTRAPVEFARGAFPMAVNRPLMTDHEREQVGICYKEQGQAAAIELGHDLVSGQTKQQRIEAWLDFCREHPDGYLYCFRGGMRSQICQQWLRDAGCDYPRVIGGYKSMRRFLIDATESVTAAAEILVVAGHTGAAKTVLLEQHPGAIDLEALAHHRGSAFGRRVGGQPSQIDFENALAIALLKRQHRRPGRPILLEDESRLIGRCALPLSLRQRMQSAPLLVVEESLASRVDHTWRKYILDKLWEWQAVHGDAEGFAAFSQDLRDSLYRIRRRLGGERFEYIGQIMDRALREQLDGQAELHREWIRELLENYYDPMYEYQMARQADRIRFRGTREEVQAFIERDCG